jgi:arylsulfatase A-like enzyme
MRQLRSPCWQCCLGVLSLAFLGNVEFTAAVESANAPRPNVIYFLVDDLGTADCGFTGGKEIRTPRIDELASEGCRLTSYYVQPLCSPTRAALLTGRYPMRYGLQVGVVRPWANYGLPLDEKTIADDLQAAGYATGLFGKWHLGHFEPEYLPRQRGFTKQYGHYNGAIDYFTHLRDGGLDWHEDGKTLHETGYSTDLIGQHAAAFVRDHIGRGEKGSDRAGRQPFFLYVAFNGVHSPYQPPRDSKNDYPELKSRRRKYASMLTAVDAAIGDVVDAVEKAGQRDNTLFIFSSDNGGPAPGKITDNGRLRGAKGGLYEGGVRVAAFATWKGKIAAGTTNDQPMHIVDWRPTLQQLCAAKPSNEHPSDGHNIWPTLSAAAPSPHASILLNASPTASALRAGDWKLVVRREDKSDSSNKSAPESVELYHLRDDESEKHNRATEQPDKVAELKKLLADYEAQAIPPKGGPRTESFVAPKVWGEFGVIP